MMVLRYSQTARPHPQQPDSPLIASVSGFRRPYVDDLAGIGLMAFYIVRLQTLWKKQ